MNWFKKTFDISVNKYYRMEDSELAQEASKWKIRGYGSTILPGPSIIERQIIIDALLKKDNANNSRYAIIVSMIAILISVISLILK